METATLVILSPLLGVLVVVLTNIIFWLIKITKIEEQVKHIEERSKHTDEKVDKLAIETKEDMERLRTDTREEIGKLSIKIDTKIDTLTAAVSALVGEVSYMKGMLEGRGIIATGTRNDTPASPIVQDAPKDGKQ